MLTSFSVQLNWTKPKQFVLPGAVEYSIIGNYFFLNKYKTPSPSDPINILGDFSSNCPEFPLPNCMGVR